MIIWGTGTPRREFLYVDDMASASVFLMQLDKQAYDNITEPMQSHINVGCGSDISIADLALAVSNTVGYNGNIKFDVSKQDGAPRKLMNSSRLQHLGWRPSVDLLSGLQSTYFDLIENELSCRLKR